MTTSEQRVFTIFGAGLSGALLAARLARLGHRVDLYERRPDPRVAGAEGGRSINLALSARGLHALSQLGLADEVMKHAIPMRGRMIHPLSGEQAFQQYGVTGREAINSVSRAGLNMALLNAAEREPGVRIVFGKRCVGVDFDRREAQVQDAAGGARETVRFDTAIGADGAFSAVRAAMQVRERTDYSQAYESHGYKELTIPPAADEAGAHGRFRLQPNALHIWPRRSYMMIALPNEDGSFTCTLFAPYAGVDGFESIRTGADVRRYFETRFPDAVPLMPTLEEDFLHNPTGSLVTVRCWPWAVGDAAALVGDAAHAVVPFYGQGMNASFEDVVSLCEAVQRRPRDLARAYDEYQRERKPNAEAIATLAVQNFVEMRDKVGSRAFRWKKAWENRLARWFPEAFKPLYTMVSFTTIPYAEAVARVERREERVRTGLRIAALVAILLLFIIF